MKTPPSIPAFKHKLNGDLKKSPQYYYPGNRLSQILHLNCSFLQQNLTDSPYCESGEIEGTQHYFLNCNPFQNLLEELF